jgi:competence protein CoiA
LIQASDANSNGVFLCPNCQQKVILKKGEIKLPHFAHKSKSSCNGFSDNESLEHIKIKMNFFNLLKDKYKVQIEPVLKNISQRPDLLLYEQKIAIEYQISPISFQSLKRRNDGYKKAGIKVFWILGSTYFKNTKNLNTINKFINSKNEVYFLNQNKIEIHSNFIKYDFIKTQSSIQEVPLLDLLERNFNSEKNNLNKKTAYPVKQLLKLQNILILKRVNLNLVNDVYKIFKTNIVLLPKYIHLGSSAYLKVNNYEYRIRILLFLADKQIFTYKQIKLYIEQGGLFFDNDRISDQLKIELDELIDQGLLTYFNNLYHFISFIPFENLNKKIYQLSK